MYSKTKWLIRQINKLLCLPICSRESNVLRRGARGSLNICGGFRMIYKENDNLNYENIEKYMKLPSEDLDRLIEEEKEKIKNAEVVKKN